jgi:hypothetical protein
MLVRSMNDQVSSEGVYREASTYYHCYAADFFLQAMVLARVNRFQFPEWMWNRLKQMFEFVAHITRSDGSIPLLGDDDGGRVLALSREDYSSFCDGLSSGAVLFGKADLKGAARAFNEETMWLLGEDAFDVFDSMDVQYHSPQHHFYAESGLCIQRSGYGVDANHLTFDCGDLGMLTGGHGHADALSLTMFGGGKEWLVDSGTAVYNSAPDWRGYFRSTRAHNTVVVDGLDQSEQGGTFSWRRKAHSRLIVSRSMPGIDYIEAEHNGYERLPDGVTHRRRVLFVKPDYWIVLDQLTGSGAHTFDFLYHFVPGAELFVFGEEQLGNADCRVRSGRSTMNLFFYASGPIQTHVDCSQYGPVQGWTSKRYGERQASPVLTATLKSFTPAVAMTVLSAAGDSPLSQRIATRTANSLAVAFRDRDYEDRCVFSPDSREIVLSNCRMRGEVFWMRSQQGVLKQLVGINAASFTVNGEVLFESDKPIPYVVVHLWENGMVIERGEHEGKVYVRDFRDRQFQRN